MFQTFSYSLGNMWPHRDFLTTREAANRLGYTLQHTRLLIREGRLRAYKAGRDWIVDPEAVDEYLSSYDRSTQTGDDK